MKKNKIVLFLLLALTMLLAGCFDPETEKTKINNTLEPFYETFLFEDIEDTMGFFSVNSDTYYQNYQSFLELFNTHNLLYEPLGISFDSVTKDSIQARAKVHITGVGPNKEKVDREVIHQFEFRMNSEGVWKIYSFSETTL